MCLYCDFDGKSKAYAIKYNKPENIFLILVNVKLIFSLDFIDENYGFVLTKTKLNLYGAQKQRLDRVKRHLKSVCELIFLFSKLSSEIAIIMSEYSRHF